jgi:uncharacterized membrane protein YvbJ
LETCDSCGTNLNENAKFCSECGAAVEKNARTEEYTVTADDVMKKVRELLHEGNVTRIIVKDETGKTILTIPVTAGVVGVLVAPPLAAMGVIAAMMTKCTVVVVRKREAPLQPGKA